MLAAVVAFLAGTATVAAPCTLPVLPILFGASVAQTSKARPPLIALGFVTSFSGVAIIFGLITQVLGVDQNALRDLAVPILVGFGLLMLWPRPFEWLVAQSRGLIGHPDRHGDQTPAGALSRISALAAHSPALQWHRSGRYTERKLFRSSVVSMGFSSGKK